MRYTSATHIGKRKDNQDYTASFHNQKDYLAVFLCDGLGGHQGGDVASEMAVSQLGYQWQHTSFERMDQKEFIQWIQQTINQENDRIIEASKKYRDLLGMGTTIVAAFFMADGALVINVGDSRAYSYNGHTVCQLTTDHSLVEELEQTGEITRDEAEKFVNQHLLTRSLGVEEEIIVDFYHLDYDDFESLLLCSDGLSNVVTMEEMLSIMSADLSLNQQAQELIECALTNKGTDNITVSIVAQEVRSDD